MKIEFNDIKLDIPESWEEIRLADYEKWHLQRPETKQEQVQFVADVCGIDAEMLLESPTQLFNVISNAIQFIFDNEALPAGKVTIGGEEYFISLSDKLTLGEWIDVDAVINSDSTSKLSELLAILCRPAGESYNADLTELRAAMFGNLTCDKALPLISFFLFRKKKSEEILNHYSTVVAQANQFLKDTEAFAQNGDGIRRLPIWQRIRYTCLIRSLRKELSKCSDFSSIG